MLLHDLTSGSRSAAPSATGRAATVETRGRLAETAAWAAARAPDLTPANGISARRWALRVSRMFAFVGIENRH